MARVMHYSSDVKPVAHSYFLRALPQPAIYLFLVIDTQRIRNL